MRFRLLVQCVHAYWIRRAPDACEEDDLPEQQSSGQVGANLASGIGHVPGAGNTGGCKRET